MARDKLVIDENLHAPTGTMDHLYGHAEDQGVHA